MYVSFFYFLYALVYSLTNSILASILGVVALVLFVVIPPLDDESDSGPCGDGQ